MFLVKKKDGSGYEDFGAAQPPPQPKKKKAESAPELGGKARKVSSAARVTSGWVSGKASLASKVWGNDFGVPHEASGTAKATIKGNLEQLIGGRPPSLSLRWKHAVKAAPSELSPALVKRSNWDKSMSVSKDGIGHVSLASAGITFDAHDYNPHSESALDATLAAVSLDIASKVSLWKPRHDKAVPKRRSATAAYQSQVALEAAKAQEGGSMFDHAAAWVSRALGLDAGAPPQYSYAPYARNELSVGKHTARLASSLRMQVFDDVHVKLATSWKADSSPPSKVAAVDGAADVDEDGDGVGAGMVPPRKSSIASKDAKPGVSDRYTFEAAAMWLRGPYEATAKAAFKASGSPKLELSLFRAVSDAVRVSVSTSAPLKPWPLRSTTTSVACVWDVSSSTHVATSYNFKKRVASVVAKTQGKWFAHCPAPAAAPSPVQPLTDDGFVEGGLIEASDARLADMRLARHLAASPPVAYTTTSSSKKKPAAGGVSSTVKVGFEFLPLRFLSHPVTKAGVWLELSK